MRLTEFADPKTYTLPADAAVDFVSHLCRLRPDRSADDPAPMADTRNQPPIKLTNLFHEL